MLVDLWRNIVAKDITRTQALGNIHALLPSLKFGAVELLEAAKLFHLLVLLVEVVEINVAQIIEATDELTPSSLPFGISGLPASSAKARTRSNVIAADVSRVRSVGALGAHRPRASVCRVARLICEIKEVTALHTVPVTIWDAVEPYAIGVVGCIAAIAQQEDILSLCRVADGTRVVLLRLLLDVLP